MAWTSPRSWVTGEVLTAALLNTHLRDQLLELNSTQSAWTTYTPTLTGFAATINLARFKQTGKIVTVEFKGTLTAVPTGTFTISAPVTPLSLVDLLPIGLAQASNGSQAFLGAVEAPAASGGVLQIRSATLALYSPTVPFAWASGQQFAFTATYEAA